MVFRDTGPLTRISFRRDIKLFLGAVVTFLSALILFLLFLLQSFVGRAREAIAIQRSVVASDVVRALDDSSAEDAASLEATLVFARAHSGVAAVELKNRRQTIRSGIISADLARLDRVTSRGTLAIYFDDSSWRRDRRVFGIVAAICVLSTLGAILLLLLYLPRITRPIEQMLDDAKRLDGAGPEAHHDEADFLIETFRRSVETLQQQEAELKHLHAIEKHRADDLERVTATLTRSLTSGFVALDPDGRIIEINAAACDILGLQPCSADDPAVEEFLASSRFGTTLRAAVASRTTLNRVEITADTSAGSKSIGLTAVPLIGESSAYLGMIALFADLTPVRELELRVREMQTLADLGEISAGIAHEFRNSLSTILGNIKLAAKHRPPIEIATRLDAASAEASQLSEAVTALLNFARPVDLQVGRMALRPMIESLVTRIGGDELAEFIIEGDAEIDGDAALLSRAVENVVRNAVESIQRKGIEGQVEIAVRDGERVVIEIRDNGVGVDPADAARLLLPFQSNRPGGFGLGLALARKIIVLHGGTLLLEGTLGEGATVTIDLPRNAAEAWRSRPEVGEFVTLSS